MSKTIEQALSDAKVKIKSAYQAINDKHGEIPESEDDWTLSNIVEAIESITISPSKDGLNINNFIGDINVNGVLQPADSSEAIFDGVKVITTSSKMAYRFAGSMQGRGLPLNSVDFNSLESIRGVNAFSGIFKNCRDLSEINFNCLTHIESGNNDSVLDESFYNCSGLRELSFPMLTNCNPNAWTETTFGLDDITVHFRKDMETIVPTFNGYSSGFGAGNLNLIYDLVGTIISGDYTCKRSEQDSTEYEDEYYTGWVSGRIVDNSNVNYMREPSKDFYSTQLQKMMYGWTFEETTYYTETRTPTTTSHLYDINGDTISMTLKSVYIDTYYTKGTAEPEVGDDLYDESFDVVGTVESIA